MRMLVEDLVAELMKMDMKASVDIQTGYNNNSNMPVTRKHIARVDNFGHQVTIVVGGGV